MADYRFQILSLLIEEPTLTLTAQQNERPHTLKKQVKFVSFAGHLQHADIKPHHLEILKYYKLAQSCVRVTRSKAMSEEDLHKYRNILVGKVKTLYKQAEVLDGVSFETRCCYKLLEENVTAERSSQIKAFMQESRELMEY